VPIVKCRRSRRPDEALQRTAAPPLSFGVRQTVDGIASITGNYPSKGGVGEKAAWFKDSEGNLLGIGQAIR
jgi:hypothetical protein